MKIESNRCGAIRRRQTRHWKIQAIRGLWERMCRIVRFTLSRTVTRVAFDSIVIEINARSAIASHRMRKQRRKSCKSHKFADEMLHSMTSWQLCCCVLSTVIVIGRPNIKMLDKTFFQRNFYCFVVFRVACRVYVCACVWAQPVHWATSLYARRCSVEATFDSAPSQRSMSLLPIDKQCFHWKNILIKLSFGFRIERGRIFWNFRVAIGRNRLTEQRIMLIYEHWPLSRRF